MKHLDTTSFLLIRSILIISLCLSASPIALLAEETDVVVPEVSDQESKSDLVSSSESALMRRVRPTNCAWSGWVNSYDGLMNYVCPGDKMIGGAYSVHSSHKEDRMFQFYCCDMVVDN